MSCLGLSGLGTPFFFWSFFCAARLGHDGTVWPWLSLEQQLNRCDSSSTMCSVPIVEQETGEPGFRISLCVLLFSVLTARSASPFVAGWFGALVSDTPLSGDSNIVWSFCNVVSELVDGTTTASSHFEWASTATKNILPINGPALSL